MSQGRTPFITIFVAALMAGTTLAAADAKPKIVPMPSPLPGPKVRRVSHDAVKPVVEGQPIVITVLTEPMMTVTVAIGSLAAAIPCSARGDHPDSYTCPSVVPKGGAGPKSVKATVRNARGETSTLTATLPIVIDPFDPWKEPNVLNTRLSPAYFAAGSADLDADARDALTKDAGILKAHPSLSIVIEGHCDPEESGDLNALSLRRAGAARDLLVTLGVPADRATPRALSASQPVSAAAVTETRPLNRRVMVLFEPAKTSANPTASH